jgi:DNA polymerase III subunit epsilon
MSAIWDTEYVVVDVETTGSDARKNRITDIACITVQGGEITSEYTSLINPHQEIPLFITTMTGISNEMVLDAPEPEEIMPIVSNIFSKPNVVFVAHNASFDWGFVNESLMRAGLPALENKKICSLKLAKRLLDKDLKKNVGSLAEYFHVGIKDRHRAYGDAHATARILIQLLEIAESEQEVHTFEELEEFHNKTFKSFRIPRKISHKLEDIIDKVPVNPGVYYFFDENDRLLYVGKAKCLKDRVKSYINSGTTKSRKIMEMFKRLHNVRWNCTGTELAALLLESREIKRLKPPFNTMEKTYHKMPFVKLGINDSLVKASMTFGLDDTESEYYGPFRSIQLVENIIRNIERNFRLAKCEPKSKIDDFEKCFYYQIKKCAAPCDDMNVSIMKEELERVRYYLSSYNDGIISQLENKMFNYSENREFELAAMVKKNISELRRVFERQQKVPTSIDKNNIIMVVPVNNHEPALEVFFIKSGKLIYQNVFGRKSDLDDLNFLLPKVYFNGTNSQYVRSVDDIDELRIITSWSHKKMEESKFIYVEGKTSDEIAGELRATIRKGKFKAFAGMEEETFEEIDQAAGEYFD